MAATLLVKPDINDVKLASKSSTPSTTSVFEEGLFDLSPQLRIRPSIHQSRPPKELLILSPKAKGKYPVIIFLHGFSLSNSYYTDLLKHIASHGYIIVAPQLYNVMPVPAWSGDGEIKSTAAVTDWLPKGLQSVLSENNGKAEADLLNLVLMGHSRGGKTAFSLAVDHNMTSLKYKELVGIDPVAGLSTGMQIRPHILTKHPDSINVGYPVMIIGTGLGSEKPNFFTPGCAPDGLNHKNLYYETKPTCYHFVTKDYGHMDMLDDSFKSLVGTVATVTCKGGKGSLNLLRRCMGGLVVAFLGNYMYGKPEDLEAILVNPELAPVTLDPVEFKKSTSHS